MAAGWRKNGQRDDAVNIRPSDTELSILAPRCKERRITLSAAIHEAIAT
jgi:hypothetical protein